jgi:hypothetical protein
VPYDPEVTRAQIRQRSVVEASEGIAAQAIRQIGQKVFEQLQTCESSLADGLVQLTTR